MRYVAIPTLWASETHVPDARPSCEVFESDPAPIHTGLLTSDGAPIYRVQDRVPLGFQGKAIVS
jgi:hypothetical protein